MNTDTLDRLIEELGPVTEKLGEGAEHLYALAVRQAIIQGVMGLILAIVLAVVPYVAYRVIVSIRKKVDSIKEAEKSMASYDRTDTDGWFFASLGAGLVGVAASLTSIGFFYSAVITLLNPQWAAVDIILRAITRGGS